MRIGRLLLVLRQGYPARTREAIESAMDGVHRLLHKEPIGWDPWVKRLPTGFQVRPLKTVGRPSRLKQALDPIANIILRVFGS